MINTDFDPTRILLKARKEKPNATFTRVEIFFVANQFHLTAEEKLIWIVIATYCANDPTLSYTLSCQQITRLCRVTSEVFAKALKKLEHMGFIKINIDAGEFLDCTISLPSIGLLAIIAVAINTFTFLTNNHSNHTIPQNPHHIR